MTQAVIDKLQELVNHSLTHLNTMDNDEHKNRSNDWYFTEGYYYGLLDAIATLEGVEV